MSKSTDISEMAAKNPDRYLGCSDNALPLARELFHQMSAFPILSPHGHVNPELLAANQPFVDPVTLLVTPDHYITRMLVSLGVDYQKLVNPSDSNGASKEQNWQLLADHWIAFAGTPSRIWFEEILSEIFHIVLAFTPKNAPRIYQQIATQLEHPDFLPQSLFSRFRIESLATTDSTSDSLEHHRAMASTPLAGRVIPTFRPDDVSDPSRKDWLGALARLETLANLSISTFADLRRALRFARDRFIENGAKATDHGMPSAFTVELSESEKERIFSECKRGDISAITAETFRGVMLMEHAQMSADDGLVMQLHPGSVRNHSEVIFERFGADRGFDIPGRCEFTNALRPLLNRFGFAERFKLALFTLDESTYSRELAPLAGAYPSVRLGPPWWFHDSLNGMRRWRDATIETAGYLNTIGFIDDTRAFLSIPVRHDLARRFDAGYLADLVINGRVSEAEARALAEQIAYHLSKDFFRL